MSTNATQAEKPTDAPLAQLRRRSDERHRIGIDREGGRHYFDPATGWLWVVDGDEITERYRTRQLAQWRDYVADRRGWAEHCIDSRSLAEFLADTLDDV